MLDQLSSHRLFVVLVLVLACAWPVTPARAFETPAESAILIDLQTHQVLFEKNADVPLPPASMSKLMTVLMVFERLKAGSLHLDDTLPVSEKAWRKGGSKMFVEVGKNVRVEDLLRGIIIQSGNDACIVIAEGLAGTEEAFAAQMSERALELGLTHTTLKNASGWPDPGHLMSARDLAKLASLVIEQYPEYYGLFSEREFTFTGIRQYARNPLLRRDLGVDGLKTGYTEAAGYSLTASAERDGRRLVMVIKGLKTANERARESERLLEYGFRHFKNYRLFAPAETVATADVWLGAERSVPLVIPQDVMVSLTPEGRRDLRVKVVYDRPIPAPIAHGAPVAHLEIGAPDLETLRVPLVAGAEVGAATLFGRMTSALGYLIWGPG
jgi:D-alanyl-D-alanine carboxypeptidase (penicillin-binding protein 5/6)